MQKTHTHRIGWWEYRLEIHILMDQEDYKIFHRGKCQ